MKAAVVTSYSAPLEIVEREVPVPGPGEVLVRLETSGLCHTDIHAAHGDWPVQPPLPFVPGHEGIGIVEQLGAGATGRHIGERVAIAWLASACGSCRYCVDGRETLCEQQHNSGYSVDGAFAEYAVARASHVVPVPDGISSLDAAPLTCAGVTTYKAMKVARVAPTEQVGVFGIGGLGHLAVQYAQIMGGTVVAIDVEPDKLALAHELGATHTINAGLVEPVAALQALGGLDVAVVLAASPHVFDEAFAAGGVVVDAEKVGHVGMFPAVVVDDGAGGLCTRHRVSPYVMAQAGMPLQALPKPCATVCGRAVRRRCGRWRRALRRFSHRYVPPARRSTANWITARRRSLQRSTTGHSRFRSS